MKSLKKIAAILLVVTFLVGISSCKSQRGCPNNFSIEIGK